MAKIIEWKEQVTQSGIQLSGTTTILKKGELLSTHAFPATDAAGRQGIITIVTVRTLEGGLIISMPAEVCRFVGEFNCSTYVDSDGSTIEPLKKS